MTGPTVIYLLPCAAMPRGCASALAIDGPPGIELLALDLEVPEDKRVHGLITAAGWRLDHGKWVCGNHPFATPAGPVTVTYWPAVPTPEEVEAAKQAVIETAHELLAEQQAATVEVTTSEPDAALYFTCQNRHPLAARTTTILENGVRRGGHHEIVCPACEADGITEVRLPDLDDEADDD